MSSQGGVGGACGHHPAMEDDLALIYPNSSSSSAPLSQEVLYCAKKAGVTHILKAGGAQVLHL